MSTSVLARYGLLESLSQQTEAYRTEISATVRNFRRDINPNASSISFNKAASPLDIHDAKHPLIASTKLR
jgi:hypothetical protein